MIVTCQQCDTSFQLDESRIPTKGIRVRCSRCKHAFFLPHPSVSQSDAIDEVAAEAVSSPEAILPGTTQDLEAPASASQVSPSESVNHEDEPEWEFSRDLPDADGAADGDHFDHEPFAEKSDEDPSGLDLDGGDEDIALGIDDDVDPELESSEPGFATDDLEPPDTPQTNSGASVAEEVGADGLDIGADDLDIDASGPDIDASGLEIDAPGFEDDADASVSEGEFGSVDDLSDLVGSDEPVTDTDSSELDAMAEELRSTSKEVSGAYVAEGSTDELGDPESWDLFENEDEPPAPTLADAGTALGTIGQKPTADVGFSTDVDLADEPIELSPLVRVAAAGGRVVGWVAVVLLFGLGLVGGLRNTAESFVAAERSVPLESFEAVGLQARWVDTARAGRVLVVNGGMRNPTRAPIQMTSSVEIVMLDAMGRPLGIEPVTAARTLPEGQLRERKRDELQRLRELPAHRLVGMVVPAGGQIPFQALLFEPPPDALRFVAQFSKAATIATSEADGLDAEVLAPGVEVLAPGPEVDAVAGVTSPDIAEPQSAESPAFEEDGPGAAAPGYDDGYGSDADAGLQNL